jgi:hypothetical protein
MNVAPLRFLHEDEEAEIFHLYRTHFFWLVSVHKWSFCPISALCSKNNPRNIKPYARGYFFHMPWSWTKILIYWCTLTR